MILRKHQAEVDNLCLEIRAGRSVRSVLASVTPGGGKSALPVILCEHLIPEHADRFLWVVPRNSLKYQGESEFIDPRWSTRHRLRAVNGNEKDPARGTSGYITTYQAIGLNASLHLKEVRKHRYIVFLDEIHHVALGSTWESALSGIIENATLVVYATGTLARGDGKAIAFLPYRGVHVDPGAVDAFISYPRSAALKDKAICPIHFKTVDGSAEWENDDGSSGSVESLAGAGDYSPHALFTALRTEYALELLWLCWNDFRHELKRNHNAQMLVVSPLIKVAKEYRAALESRIKTEVPIATSEDSAEAHRIISAYKRGVYKVIVTVSLAYEGLSVPNITHIACLTHIRSVPWLEQCFARGNRLAPGKREAWIYGPRDRNFLEAIRMIEEEQLVPLNSEGKSRDGGEDPEESGGGESSPWITPLRSAAAEKEAPEDVPRVYAESVSLSQQEEVLRTQIRAQKEMLLSRRRNGAVRSMRRVFEMTIRRVVDKDLNDMTVEELTAVWLELRRRFM